MRSRLVAKSLVGPILPQGCGGYQPFSGGFRGTVKLGSWFAPCGRIRRHDDPRKPEFGIYSWVEGPAYDAGQPDMEAHHALAMSIISRRERSAVPGDTWEQLELFIGHYYQ